MCATHPQATPCTPGMLPGYKPKPPLCPVLIPHLLPRSFFSGLAASGLLAGEEAQERCFRILTELAVAHCLASESLASPGLLNFAAVDAVARLALLLARHFPEARTHSAQSK